MKYVGMDLGKRQSDVCVMDEGANVIERFQIRTRRSSLSKRFANMPRCKIAIESCRDSGWVYEHLTSLGHEVVVVDTTRARTIGVGLGRRKTDRRDAEALARAAAHNILPRAHVLSANARRLRDVLHARDQLIRLRARLVTMLRGQFQGKGFVVPSCGTEHFAKRLRASGLQGIESVEVQSALRVLDSTNTEIDVLTTHLKAMAEQEEAYERLCTVPGVKLIVTLAFIAAIDDPNRFRTAHEVQPYLGLVPSEYTTGGKRRMGRITRCGNGMARRLLVQAARSMLRTRSAQEDPLVVWAKEIAVRRGNNRAAVALARRLAGVLWAMWADGTCYDPKGLARQSWAGLSRRARNTKQVADKMAVTRKRLDLKDKLTA